MGGVLTASPIGIVLMALALVVARVSLTSAATISADARTEANTLMADRCAVCHGDNGDGNGPGASNMNPGPQNFHDRKWQHGVSDATLVKAIIYGGAAVGVNASMPSNPDLADRPDIVGALVQQIRTWGK
ncbi:MAG: c-type cytochrome [Candidatus Binataceae bacterium]